MNTIKHFMIRHPFISILIIFPFSYIITASIFQIILNLLLPCLFALWISGWLYTTIIGYSWKKNIDQPFWFFHRNDYSI